MSLTSRSPCSKACVGSQVPMKDPQLKTSGDTGNGVEVPERKLPFFLATSNRRELTAT